MPAFNAKTGVHIVDKQHIFFGIIYWAALAFHVAQQCDHNI